MTTPHPIAPDPANRVSDERVTELRDYHQHAAKPVKERFETGVGPSIRAQHRETAEALTELLALRQRPDASGLVRLREWCDTYGAALKPTAGNADTFGDGMRAAKRQVADILSAPRAAPQVAQGEPVTEAEMFVNGRDAACSEIEAHCRTFFDKQGQLTAMDIAAFCKKLRAAPPPALLPPPPDLSKTHLPLDAHNAVVAEKDKELARLRATLGAVAKNLIAHNEKRADAPSSAETHLEEAADLLAAYGTGPNLPGQGDVRMAVWTVYQQISQENAKLREELAAAQKSLAAAEQRPEPSAAAWRDLLHDVLDYIEGFARTTNNPAWAEGCRRVAASIGEQFANWRPASPAAPSSELRDVALRDVIRELHAYHEELRGLITDDSDPQQHVARHTVSVCIMKIEAIVVTLAALAAKQPAAPGAAVTERPFAEKRPQCVVDLVVAADRLRLDWSESSEPVRNTLWKALHTASKAVAEQLGIYPLRAEPAPSKVAEAGGAEREGVEGLAATHRCRICGALWRVNPADAMQPHGSWSLVSPTCGKCCDNVAMGRQIEKLLSPPPITAEDRAWLDKQRKIDDAN